MKIRIQSFIDVITNSSTEIYVEATESTIKVIKDIINGMMEICGNNFQTCDDLFDITLNSNTILIESKNSDNELLDKVANLFMNFQDTYNIWGEHNG